ncbi:LL-diaminopimelate aminotransferase [Dehalogenimonas etheniformans]|uniref:Aminotransferase n=1 Tax=Dehalogenimonas etheniformans TaxID=1536648 RepID=A0A2P5P9G5_9CHLR|nr:LL-diaminopimelate aminotransferase [Dehalogenimonas etheniformans]PPD58948.1 LL-diaminopimelate aminotransferase [Dehalogenimonas etheniformans]QNT76283.1 LL-diaminopimelate aminotransferase [Dehalogenimonas etheniformans]
MKIARRIENLPPYLFVTISKKIVEKRARGEEVISFGIGDPDLPTPKNIIDRLCLAAHDPANHRYPESEGLPELRRAIATWYQQRFDVVLDPDSEVLPLIGSKEGIGHVAWCMLNPGDVALIPDPAYPVYGISTALADAVPYHMPLTADNNFLPDLDSIPHEVLEKAKLMWICYPNNPTGAIADVSFFDKVVAFAKAHDIAVCHDGPYTEVAYDGYRPPSFLQAAGSKEVGVEFHSLSKSYNMTGWRVGMAVGNAKMIDALKRFKSNIDSGVPQAIQLAAIEALTGPQDDITRHNAIYQRRRDLIVETLQDMGLEVQTPQASLYVWAKVPKGFTSASFATELLDQVGVVVTPGTGYGAEGEGYVRLSLTLSDASLVKGLSKLSAWRGTVGRSKSR